MIDGLVDLAGIGLDALRALGGFLLLMIGLSAAMRPAPAEVPVTAQVARPWGWVLALGLIVGLANPQAIVFFLAVLPQIVPSTGIDAQTVALVTAGVVLSSAAAQAPVLGLAPNAFRSRLGLALRRACGLGLAALGLLSAASSLA